MKLKYPKDCVQCLTLVAVSLLGLLIFNIHNKDQKLTRYYEEEHKYCYYLLTAIYSILVIGVVFNMRYFFNFYSKEVFKFIKINVYKKFVTRK